MTARVDSMVLMRNIAAVQDENKKNAVGVKRTVGKRAEARTPVDPEEATGAVDESRHSVMPMAVPAIQTRKVVVRKEAFFQDAYFDARTIDSTIEAMGNYAFFEPIVCNAIYVVESAVGGGCVESDIDWYSC